MKVVYKSQKDKKYYSFDDKREISLYEDLFHPKSSKQNTKRLKSEPIIVLAIPESNVKQFHNNIHQQFIELAEKWYRETLHSSGYVEVILHPAYQRIIGLGKDVIPLILRELQDEPLEWFWALRALTGEDPTMPEMAGKRDEMAKAWLDWGKERGFI